MSSKIPTAGQRGDRASTIADFLQSNILSGHYRAGDRLPSEADLCAHFGVSRPTLREALGRLSANGLIVSRRGAGGGAFITRPQPEDCAARIGALVALACIPDAPAEDDGEAEVAWRAPLLAARIQLQMGCARLAALIGADIGDVRAEIDRQSDFSIDDSSFRASCLRMYLALCAASGNPVMTMLGEAVIEAEFRRLTAERIDTRTRARLLSFHVRLANGIAGQRPEDTDAALNALWEYEFNRLGQRDGVEQGQNSFERPPRMRDLRIPPVQHLNNGNG
ncbi:MAG: FadR family transcriptional regulator [Pararhodobacter sp.]|nr:FadR family transcriptional regulator [Pararhodobacter sp.]